MNLLLTWKSTLNRGERRHQKPTPIFLLLQHRLPLLAAALLLVGLGIFQCAAVNPPPPSDIIQFLNQTIDWYRQLDVERQMAVEPNDVMVVNDNRRVADQVVRLAFDFARAKSQPSEKQTGLLPSEGQGAVASRYQSLLEYSTKLEKKVQESQAQLQSLRKKLDLATGPKRRSLQSEIDEVQSELDLTAARRDAVHSMVEFVSGASADGLGAAGVRAQIEALARTLPAELTEPPTGKGTNSSASAPFIPVPTSGPNRSEPSGIWGLTADLFALSRRVHTLQERIRLTDALSENSKALRKPLVTRLKEFSQRGDELANQPESQDPGVLAEQKKGLDILTSQFKQISAAVLPLSKQGILLGAYKTSLTNWQSTMKNQYAAELRSLVFRVAVLGIILAAVLGFAELWRRTIHRYVHDVRRKYQFLLLRRIVLWCSIVIIIAFAFASQLGTVVTFAGLLTAGVAVALQNVILSIAGYFFLIGKYGIRVGDRVQIAGVTGEVLDIGLVRLHLMELGSGGAETPSGRVVAFSNSIVFQPAAGLFKQIPGTSFVWHEIILTLSPDSDYRAVEERLLGAVEAVFAEYHEDMERQRRHLETALNTTVVDDLRPKSRLRLTQGGLEAAIRYPVDLRNAAEIDDRVTRELLKAIDQEPSLKLVASETTSVKLRTDLSAAGPASG